MAKTENDEEQKQLLHLVFGGELTDIEKVEFSNLEELDIVGIFPDYATAYDAWKDAAQRSVDNAHMRYFIAHLHRLRDEKAESHLASLYNDQLHFVDFIKRNVIPKVKGKIDLSQTVGNDDIFRFIILEGENPYLISIRIGWKSFMRYYPITIQGAMT